MDRLILSAVLLTICQVCLSQVPIVQSPNVINYVNSIKPGWRAGVNPRFENVTMAEAVKLLGLLPDNVPPRNKTNQWVEAVYLPEEFDARTQWPKCVQVVRDQQACGMKIVIHFTKCQF